jgi:hypothetical protein
VAAAVEVVFALREGKRVVPLQLDPEVKPTLLLARRQWIDFSRDDDFGLASLLRFLAGDEAAARPPALPMIAGLPPLDFAIEIVKHTAGFTGREW